MSRTKSNLESTLLEYMETIVGKLERIEAEVTDTKKRVMALEEHLLVQKPLYEEPETVIPHLITMSEKTGNAIKRKPKAYDVKEALGKLLPKVPPEEAYNSVLKCCTERIDGVVLSPITTCLPAGNVCQSRSEAKCTIEPLN